MTYYVRTTSGGSDAVAFKSKADAVTHVQTVTAQQKAHGRAVTRQGEQLVFHEKATGQLFDTMWVEDEHGNHVHVPIV